MIPVRPTQSDGIVLQSQGIVIAASRFRVLRIVRACQRFTPGSKSVHSENVVCFTHIWWSKHQHPGTLASFCGYHIPYPDVKGAFGIFHGKGFLASPGLRAESAIQKNGQSWTFPQSIDMAAAPDVSILTVLTLTARSLMLLNHICGTRAPLLPWTFDFDDQAVLPFRCQLSR